MKLHDLRPADGSRQPRTRVGRGIAVVHAKCGYQYGMVDRFVAKVSVDHRGRFTVCSDVPDSGTGIVAGPAARSLLLLRYSGDPEGKPPVAVADYIGSAGPS